MKTNKIQEVDVIVKNANDVKTLASTNSLDKNSKIYVDPTAKPGAVTEEDEMLEPEAIITPQDDATIKYLSNVRDKKTGEISQPFTIADKKYQMVRGIKPSKEIVMAVFCHDELNESGENVIHPIEHFEKTIVQPIMEKEAMMQQEVMFGNDIEEKVKPKVESKKEQESLNLSEFKHYLVNEKSGKFRKFKNIVELAAAVMDKEEKYMPIKEFRKFFENRVFGGKKETEMNLMEVAPTGEETDEEMNAKAKKLMVMISKRIPSNVIETIKTPVAKREVIAAFAELIGVPRQGLPSLINGLKDLAKTKSTSPATAPGTAPTAGGLPPENQLAPVGVAERKVITKAKLTESLSQPKVIKTIKVKDIK